MTDVHMDFGFMALFKYADSRLVHRSGDFERR